MRSACLLIPLLCLLSCTAIHPPEPALPPRSGVVPGQTITVGANQNIYGIAQDHGVSMRDIIVLNGLHAPFALKTGQSLVLPFKRGDASVPQALPPPDSVTPAVPMGDVQQAPLSAVETQALPPPVTSAPIAAAPPTPAPVANPAPSPFGKPSAPLASAPVEALNAPAATSPKPVATTLAPVAAPVVAAAPMVAAVDPGDANTSPPNMVWPVQGAVLSGFGPKGQGVNNDGVNIGAPKGAPVVAAANGIVVYAGNEMKGFGNLVLIRHEGGWVTAYAYLDRVLVAKDAVVAQGDMIGTVGKSGAAATPQLHFEVRHGGKVVDPNGVVKGQ